jgi:sialic acid synthase SpsE
MKLTQDSPYLVAEIGWNFLGNLKLAKTMIFKAKQSGALAVKFMKKLTLI